MRMQRSRGDGHRRATHHVPRAPPLWEREGEGGRRRERRGSPEAGSKDGEGEGEEEPPPLLGHCSAFRRLLLFHARGVSCGAGAAYAGGRRFRGTER